MKKGGWIPKTVYLDDATTVVVIREGRGAIGNLLGKFSKEEDAHAPPKSRMGGTDTIPHNPPSSCFRKRHALQRGRELAWFEFFVLHDLFCKPGGVRIFTKDRNAGSNHFPTA